MISQLKLFACAITLGVWAVAWNAAAPVGLMGILLATVAISFAISEVERVKRIRAARVLAEEAVDTAATTAAKKVEKAVEVAADKAEAAADAAAAAVEVAAEAAAEKADEEGAR